MVKILRKTINWVNNVKYHILMGFIIWFVCLWAGFFCFVLLVGIFISLFCLVFCFGVLLCGKYLLFQLLAAPYKNGSLGYGSPTQHQCFVGADTQNFWRLWALLCCSGWAAVSCGWLLPVSGYNWGAALTYFVGFWNSVTLNLSYKKELQTAKMTAPSNWVKSSQIIYLVCPISLIMGGIFRGYLCAQWFLHCSLPKITI